MIALSIFENKRKESKNRGLQIENLETLGAIILKVFANLKHDTISKRYF